MSQPAFEFDDAEVDDPTNPTFTVGELADAINDQLRRGFRDGVWVRGEISGLRNNGPHTYFQLIENGPDGKAVLEVQLFAPAKRRLTPILKRANLELRNGMKVRIHGHLDFWAQGGRLGMKMSGIDPRYTLGDIAQSRDEIVRRLVAEGLLDTNKRRPLSPIPLRVGVVASVDSAAWHDFHDEIQRSGLGFRLTIADVRVQGEFAENMITAAVARMAMRGQLDAIVVIRGGGARNELAVFDSEKIARMIANSPIPVLTGLGHEVDRSVADDVAHTALKTPTACAGALIDRARQYVAETEQTHAAILQRSTTLLTAASAELSDTAHRIARRTHAAVERSDERLSMRIDRLTRAAPAAATAASAHLDRSARQLSTACATRLAGATQHLDRSAGRLADRPAELLDRAQQQLEVFAARTASLDPAVQLARGWTITRNEDGAIVRSITDVSAGDVLTTDLVDGTLTSAIQSTAEHPSDPKAQSE